MIKTNTSNFGGKLGVNNDCQFDIIINRGTNITRRGMD